MGNRCHELMTLDILIVEKIYRKIGQAGKESIMKLKKKFLKKCHCLYFKN